MAAPSPLSTPRPLSWGGPIPGTCPRGASLTLLGPHLLLPKFRKILKDSGPQESSFAKGMTASASRNSGSDFEKNEKNILEGESSPLKSSALPKDDDPRKLSSFRSLRANLRDEPDNSWMKNDDGTFDPRRTIRSKRSSIPELDDNQWRREKRNVPNQTRSLSPESRFAKPKRNRTRYPTEWIEVLEEDESKTGENVNDFNFVPKHSFGNKTNSFYERDAFRNETQRSGRRGEMEDGDEEENEGIPNFDSKSRGEIYIENFLEREKNRAKRLAANQKEKDDGWSSRGRNLTKDENVKEKIKIIKDTRPSCYGCGAVLQYQNENSSGYVLEEDFEIKKKHKQLKQLLCVRCQSLSQGQAVNAINEKERNLISVEELRMNLTHLKFEKALIVKLVDIIDFNGSFISKIRSIVGKNPIILIITKIDLLPKGTDFHILGDWIVENIQRKKLNVLSVHLISSKSKIGINMISNNILREKQGRDVYVLGASNVGKSLFISALLEEMSQKNLKALAAKRKKPISSFMPGTTLGNIKINVFLNGGDLYDTPGVHLHHRMSSVLKSNDLIYLFPRNRLRGYIHTSQKSLTTDLPFQYENESVTSLLTHDDTDLSEMESRTDFYPDCDQLQLQRSDDTFSDDDIADDGTFDNYSNLANRTSLEGKSIFWGGICRIDVVRANLDVNLTFYGSSSIKIFSVQTKHADKYYENEIGKSLVPPIIENVQDWEGLPMTKQVKLKSPSYSRPFGDIVISGLGWITVSSTQGHKDSQGMNDDPEFFEAVVHTPKGVEVFLRPAMPVGPSASTWYEFQELSELEEMARPQVYCEVLHKK